MRCDNCLDYHFYVVYHTITTEVYPLNWIDCTIVPELQEKEIFYRKRFNGALTFGGKRLKDDFDLFWAIEQVEPCERLDFFILLGTDIIFEGYFSTASGDWDIDNCNFTVTPETADAYTDILDLADEEHNILSITPAVTVYALKGVIDETYTRNRWLMDVIEYLGINASHGVMPGATISSSFFTFADNPVTGGTNKFTLLTIAQKSDIIDPDSSDPATIAMLSWNGLMQILKAMFQVYWDYDEDTDIINIEHISWWGSDAGMDLRTQKMSRRSNKYSYLKEDMPKYEKFSFMEQDALNFVGTPIRYENACVNQDPKTNILETVVPVTTDLEFIVNSPDLISKDGFVILCNYLDPISTHYFVEYKSGVYHADIKLNNRLAWGDLHDAFFRHNRSWISGYLNNILCTFYSSKKVKKQIINAVNCNLASFNPKNYITTELGEDYFGGAKGQVKIAEIKPQGEINFTLIYGQTSAATPTPPQPPEQECVTVTGHIEILINQDLFIYFLFDKPIPADIDIRIRDFVYDDSDVLQCTSAWHDWTFFKDETSSVFNVAICAYLDPGWCAVIEIEYDDDEICDMDIEPDPDYSCTEREPVIYTII